MKQSRPETLNLAPSRDSGWLYVGVFLFALLLRLLGLGHQNLWHDEFLSLQTAEAPLHQLPDLLRTLESNKPPLYFAILHSWVGVAAGEFWLRLPSAIFGALSCLVAAAIGQQLFAERRGAWLGFLLAVSPFHIYYSQEARPFALWGLFTGIALLFHLKFCASLRLRFLLGYVASAVLACYTFTYALFIIGFSLVFSLVYRPVLSKRRLWQIAVANGLVVLLYLPWLLRVVDSIAEGVSVQVIHRGPVHQAAAYSFFSLGLGTSFGPTIESLRLMGSRVLREAPADAALLVAGFLLLAVFTGVGLLRLWRTNRNAFYFSFLGILVLWGTPALLNLLNPDVPYNPRYAFPALLPIMVAILAVCFATLRDGGWRWGLVGLFLIAVGISLSNHFFASQYARDDLRAAARFLRELQPPPQRLIVCSGHLTDVFRYYYATAIPLHPVRLMGAAPTDELEPVLNSVANAERFALVYSRPDHGDLGRVLPAALQAQHRLIEKRRWTGVEVFVFGGDAPGISKQRPSGTASADAR